MSGAPQDTPSARQTDVQVVIVGAGISGIGVAIGLLARGITSFTLLERADDLGGTWRDNTYPGVAVDIPSSSYCFSFETDFPWSRVYARGAELQAYVRHCARKYAIDAHIRYGAHVVQARFDPDSNLWTTVLSTGDTLTSRYLVAATGVFTTPTLPDLPGLASFAGTAFHSARWRHDHDLAGLRVGVVGTGASAVQIVPCIAGEVAHLAVFQRTPIWVAPRADRELPDAASWRNLRRYGLVRSLTRLASEAGIEALTAAVTQYGRVPFLVHTIQALVRRWMASQVTDPTTRARLLPDYTLGCKRPATSNTYLPTFNEPHVSLVIDPIARIEPAGVRTADGTLHPLDTLVLATGFLTTERGNGPAFEVYGLEGQELGQFWEDHRLQAYEGVAVPGFPNFFLTAGPYSGGFNWFTMLETHLDVILGCLDEASRRGTERVEVRPEAHDAYMHDLWRRAEGTVFKHASCATANSYYIDRHGDAALPLPATPWWRIWRFRRTGLAGFDFL